MGPRLGVAVAFFVGPLALAPAAVAAARPDLQVAAVSAPATVSASGVLAVSETVRNTGKGAARKSVAGIFLSRDRRAGADVKLGTASVRALGARLAVSAEVEVVLARSVRVGRYYVVVCADTTRGVAESRETNNCRVAARAVSVVKARAELAVSGNGTLPGTLQADRAGSLTVTVRNRGGKPSPPGLLELLLSTDGRRDAGDTVAGSRPIPRLAARAKYAKPVSLTVPYSLPSGSYRLLACIGKTCRATGSTSVVDVAVDAPPNPTDAPTDFSSSVAFLYSGAGASQQGVTPGAIEAGRVAVLRGRVVDRAGDPVAGVRVTALGHPELGFTRTRPDGMFDLAVNGGGPVEVDYRTDGYLPVQRTETAPWRDFASVADVVLTTLDSAVTKVTSGAADWQMHRANPVTDGDGTRRPTLLFAPGTHASLRMANGSLQAAPSISVRATEFTAGATGPDAMPGQLPAASGYTYAVEYSADEAITAGAVGVTFDQPVITYTEDFVGFPVGAVVPAGTYSPTAGRWEANPNGIVVRVVSISGGVATLDVDGDAVADTGAALDALGITDAELAQVGALYAPGTALMRVATTHFSSADYNWPYGPPTGAGAPDGGPQTDAPGGSCAGGSIIICESQTLAETIPVAGTPYSLVYGSDRVPGRIASRSIRLRLWSGSGLTPGAIHVIIQVAGQTVSQTFPGNTATTTFTWDGRDAYGRPVLGWVPATVEVGYEYEGQYYASRTDQANAFGSFSGVTFTTGAPPGRRGSRHLAASGSVPSRTPIVIWRSWQTTVGIWDSRGLGLGGWVLDPVETYDRDAGLLKNGDGTTERADRAAYDAVSLLAGWNGTGNPGGFAGDGGNAVGARLAGPDGVAVAPDGSVYVADVINSRVRRIAPDGVISTVYGGTACPEPAAGCRPVDVAVGPDGALYVADIYRYRVLRVEPGGGETLVAGNGTPTYSGDGGPATLAGLARPASIAVGPDGSVWITDTAPDLTVRIRRVAPDGTITAAIGGGPAPSSGNPFGDGLPADQVRIANLSDNALAVGPDGTVYVADVSTFGFIRAIGPDGISHRFAGGNGGVVGDGGSALAATLYQIHALAAGPDGSVYIGEPSRVRKVLVDGTISTIAGDGVGGTYGGDGGPAGSSQLSGVFGIAISPDGGLVFVDHNNQRVRVVRSVLKGVALGALSLASADGSEVYLFDAAGRHVETRDGLTGTVTMQLGYDAAGRLSTLTDRHGLVTTIEHDAAGLPTAIVAPGGQRTALTVNPEGFLSTITDPLAQVTHLAYAGSGGLLATLTDNRGKAHQFGYDALGLLESDQDPAGGLQTLSRTDLPAGVEVTDTIATKTGSRQVVYRFDALADGSMRWRQTASGGALTETLQRRDGTVRIAYADGRVEDLTTGSDPRYGARVGMVTRDVMAEPAGPTSTTTAQRLITTASGGGIASLTDSVTVNGAIWNYVYTAATHAIVFTSPAGRTETTTLTTSDDVASFQRGTETRTAFTYDARGRMTHATRGTLAFQFAYDAGDRLTSITDALGHITAYGHDAAGRPTSVTLPSARVVGIHRDASGNVDRIDMPGPPGVQHVLTSDPLDRLASYTAPGRSPLVVAYTPDRQPDLVTQPDGNTIGYAYDSSGRPTTDTFGEGTAAQTYSDATARVASATRSPAGGGTSQVSTYEHVGDLVTRDNQTGTAVGDFKYTFSNDLDLSSWSLDGTASAVTRDADRLVTGDGPWTRVVDGNGAVTSISNAADATDVVSYTYDGLGRLASRTVTVNGAVAHSLSLTYDSAGRIATRTDPDGTRTYAYDADGRLTGVSGAETSAFAYDARDNLTSRPGGTAAYTADDEVSGDTYDANGRLSAHSGDTFSYSARGELLSSSIGATDISYTYDAAGRRVSRTQGGVPTQYLYGSLTNPVQVTATKQGGVTTVYRYGAFDELTAIERSGSRYLVATDQVGSPVGVYDAATGAEVLTRTYDAYGGLVGTTGTFDLPIGFAGGIADPVTGLVRFGLRDYDPMNGRFTAPDPILFDGGQFNLYAYAGDDPVGSADPLGLDSSNQSVPAPKFCGPGDRLIRNEIRTLRRDLQKSRDAGPGPYAPFTPHQQDMSNQIRDMQDQLTPQSDGKPTSAQAFSSSGAATKA